MGRTNLPDLRQFKDATNVSYKKGRMVKFAGET